MKYVQPNEAAYMDESEVTVPHSATNASPIERSVCYFNYLRRPVYVSDRSGMTFKLDNEQSRRDSLVIRVTYKLNKKVVIDPSKTFHRTADKTPTGKLLLELITKFEEDPKRDPVLIYEYTYRYEDLEKVSSGVYLAELDILVSMVEDVSRIPEHPYARSSDRLNLISTDTNVNDNTRFGYSVYIVSNGGTIPDHFINMNGVVYRVPSNRNHSLQDGVYVCSSAPALGQTHKDALPTVKRYSIEEALTELRLYLTYDEAVSGGDYFAEKEKELKQKLQDAKVREAEIRGEEIDLRKEYDDRKRELEMEMLQYKQKLETESMAASREHSASEHMYRMQSMRDKDYYESRQYQRKDSSEFLKSVPVLITSILAIGTLAYNLGSKK